ncbi:hypothetical protein GWI33_019980 [Rhynchophorus ferrugineus]|uniref:Uncharacterized protein n=1 Tax=Rhynchophorus ferrugineus TaxID=354439 RepID=A0A834HV65_RHYFE|nr:hypothetical protein GWI33_019980 [Rhynchophorus ferrugineus]
MLDSLKTASSLFDVSPQLCACSAPSQPPVISSSRNCHSYRIRRLGIMGTEKLFLTDMQLAYLNNLPASSLRNLSSSTNSR